MAEGKEPAAWRRIYVIIRDRLQAGDYQIGAPVPSSAQFATKYGFNEPAAREALKKLTNEGVLAAHQGRGRTLIRVPVGPADEPSLPEQVRALTERVGDLEAEVAELKRRLPSDAEAADTL